MKLYIKYQGSMPCGFRQEDGSAIPSGVKLSLWSDCADNQTDLNLRCSHMPTCTLCWLQAHFIIRPNKKNKCVSGNGSENFG